VARAPTELCVLVLAPSGRDAAIATDILRGDGMAADACRDAGELCARLRDGAGAVLLAEEAVGPRAAAALRDALAAQETWSDIPVVMLTTGGILTAESRRAVGLLEPHANLTLLERPVRRMTLITALRMALRVRNRQYAMREHLAERKALLDEARRAHAAAERANRAKDEFLAMLSHELRSPLQGIRGWVAIMRRDAISDAQRTRALDTIDRIVNAQSQLVNDLLDVSRVAAGKLEIERGVISLGGIVCATVDEALPTAEAKGVILSCAVNEVGAVRGDAERLRQVFANLLSNALKFTPPGGRIAVTCVAAGEHAVVTVSDTGKGITADFLPHVFDRFTQADTSATRRHGGLGLGLAIARHLVALHGGSIAAQSAGEGQGAAFTVRLPLLSGADAPRHVDIANGKSRGDLRGIRVLLVDDDPDALEALRIALDQSGAEVAVASSATLAFAAFSAVRPDVLVSDISMPGEDGYSLLARIRAAEARSSSRTPAIALSGFASPEDRDRTAAAGFQAHVAKPVDPDALISLLHTIAPRAAR
jgi:signal transduction histidine kinase/CheY-like chemotaxis protein